MTRYRFALAPLVASCVAATSAGLAAQTPLTPYQSLGREILRQLVETNTEYSIGSTTKAAELMAARFRSAGWPAADVQIVGLDTGRDAKDKNLVVRYRGVGKRRPILLIGHLDVVEARPSDWVLDPFTLTERDGHFYGRGTLDMKNGDAAWVAALLRMKQEGILPAGDYILALTAGEEGGGGYNGIQWLLTNRRDLIDAQYVLNADAGGGELRNGKPTALDVQAAEKVFYSLRLTARNPGGHSSLPRKDNAIYALAAALGRLSAYDFPARTNPVTRGYFAHTAQLMSGGGDVAADMRAVSAQDTPDSAAAARLAARSAYYNAQLRTTCVATLLQGGHAENALPQTAQATVNCRMLPGTDTTEVRETIRRLVADSTITVTSIRPALASPPSPLPADVERTIEQVTRSVWGPLAIVPNMETGATDGLFLRNAGIPVFGVSGLFADPTIDADNRAHGLNERIGVKEFYDQLEFTYRLLKQLMAVDSAKRLTSEATDPDFGPNVTIFDPTIPAATIQAKLDAAFKTQETSEFGDARLAFLFKPGTYDVDTKVGFYTQLSGLGLSPDDVVINGGIRADARWHKGNATLNFWRIAENMTVRPTGGFDRWAVSQAAPMRRMHIRGDLVLDDGGWSSGGFLADSKVDGQVRSGSQQQWLTRNSELGSWMGSNWNMVFVGTRNAPPQSFPDPPYSTLPSAPVIREKPFLYVDARGAWRVFVPALHSNTSGTTWSAPEDPGVTGVSLPIGDFLIVKPSTSVAAMNDAIARGKHLIITPGTYHVDAPLHVTHANTIVLGLGLATLVAENGATAITVDDVDGVTIAGLLIEAGATNSPVLIHVGPPGSSATHAANPTLLSDVFVRVGGASVGKATQSLVVNSNNVIGDHLWLWRADHGISAGSVGWTLNTAANGLVVNGNDVIMYGLFVEHYQEYQVRWNGNRGRTYMFQNEMPYDVPEQSAWMNGSTKGFDAYSVAAWVTSHVAWGLGSYCFFNKNPSIAAEHAFEAPVAPNVRFHDMVTVSLGGGKGSILHVINDTGPAATAGAVVQKLVGAK